MTSKLKILKALTPAALLLISGPAAADEVGVTAAVNPEATGTPPGGTARTLYVGNDVMFEERIKTGPVGQTQILFLDESALTVGPDSELVLDTFVYDPSASTGDMAISVGAGVLRFVGGKIAKQEDVVFKTPHATIGIRGSSLGLQTGADQTTSFRTSGTMTCERDGTKYVVQEAGWACVAGADGLDLKQVDPMWLRNFYASLNGPGDNKNLDPEDVDRVVAADCGSGFAVNAQRCGSNPDGDPPTKDIEDAADLPEAIGEDARDDIEPIIIDVD